MEKRYSGFPSGYEHLETVFQPLRSQVDDLINQIENMPPDKGYQLKNEFGGNSYKSEESRVYKIARLTAQKEALQLSMIKIAEDATVNADPAIKKEVLDKADRITYSEKYAELLEDKDISKQPKDLEKSQNYAQMQSFDVKYLVQDDVEEISKATTLKASIDDFLDKTELKTVSKDDAKNYDKIKEKLADFKDNKTMFEDNMDKFFNQTSYDFAVNRDDILNAPDPFEKDREREFDFDIDEDR